MAQGPRGFKLKNVVFIGPPGAGKGTQAAILDDMFSFCHVSTGDLLRAEIAKGSELGNKIKTVMDNGQLVSDDLVAELLKANIDLSSKQYIFDGFPRNVSQAEIFQEEIMDKSEYLAVLFDVDTDKLVDRIVNRRVSSDGAHIYNLKTNPPKVDGVCDVSGLPLVQRKDDTEEVVRNRMNVYLSETKPLVEYYKSKNKLKSVDADLNIDEVTKQIASFLNN